MQLLLLVLLWSSLVLFLVVDVDVVVLVVLVVFVVMFVVFVIVVVLISVHDLAIQAFKGQAWISLSRKFNENTQRWRPQQSQHKSGGSPHVPPARYPLLVLGPRHTHFHAAYVPIHAP